MFRKRSAEDDGNSDDDSKLPLYRDSDEPVKKKAHTIWSNAIIEQTLSEEGSEMRVEQGVLVSRGVESFDILNKKKEVPLDETKEISKNLPSSDDPFGDVADIGAVEGFGVRKEQVPDIPPRGEGKGDCEGYWLPRPARGRGGRHRGSEGVRRRWDGPPRVDDPLKLVNKDYSIESLLATELAPGMPQTELGAEIAKAFGEAGNTTIAKIVENVSEEKALHLFNETKKVEAAGGMMINNGSRRRTPGGVFIFLFKGDVDISQDVKDKCSNDNWMQRRQFNCYRGRGNYRRVPFQKRESTEQKLDVKPMDVETEELVKNAVESVLDIIKPIVGSTEMET